MAEQTSDRRCRGTTKDGTACRARPLPGDEWCPNHAPDHAEWRAERNRRGGRNKSNAARAKRAMPADLAGVGDMLLRAMHAVEAGTMEPAQGNTLANLARSYVAVTEYGEWAQRIERLEDAAAKGQAA